MSLLDFSVDEAGNVHVSGKHCRKHQTDFLCGSGYYQLPANVKKSKCNSFEDVRVLWADSLLCYVMNW